VTETSTELIYAKVAAASSRRVLSEYIPIPYGALCPPKDAPKVSLTRTDFKVLGFLLALRKKKKTETLSISQRIIAEKTGLPRRSVQRALEKLVKARLIESIPGRIHSYKVKATKPIAFVPVALFDNPEISILAVRVYALLRLWQGRKKYAYAKIQTIANALGQKGHWDILDALKLLRSLGWITVTGRRPYAFAVALTRPFPAKDSQENDNTPTKLEAPSAEIPTLTKLSGEEEATVFPHKWVGSEENDIYPTKLEAPSAVKSTVSVLSGDGGATAFPQRDMGGRQFPHKGGDSFPTKEATVFPQNRGLGDWALSETESAQSSSEQPEVHKNFTYPKDIKRGETLAEGQAGTSNFLQLGRKAYESQPSLGASPSVGQSTLHRSKLKNDGENEIQPQELSAEDEELLREFFEIRTTEQSRTWRQKVQASGKTYLFSIALDLARRRELTKIDAKQSAAHGAADCVPGYRVEEAEEALKELQAEKAALAHEIRKCATKGLLGSPDDLSPSE